MQGFLMPHAKLYDRENRCAQVERHIQCETLRQIRRLDVRTQQGQTIVSGSAPSYYVRQLAERAAMDLVPLEELDFDISVESYGDTGRVPYRTGTRHAHAEMALA
jgi:hypothetical protein